MATMYGTKLEEDGNCVWYQTGGRWQLSMVPNWRKMSTVSGNNRMNLAIMSGTSRKKISTLSGTKKVDGNCVWYQQDEDGNCFWYQ